ncbi:hypothetical protein ACHAXR_005978 [Thalassiosira sp. AJA248-18]
MLWAQIVTSLLLFFLVMGMASTVDIRDILPCTIDGLCCQFVILPLIGYLIVLVFSLPPPVGITLLIVVSSPGGSYSNWWCSVFNADLALSVSMTTVSTLLSVGFLPLNLAIYSYAAYAGEEHASGESVLKSINFASIFISLAVVIAAIGVGIFCSWKFDTPQWHRISYLGGNISGILLIIFSTVLSFVGGDDGNEPTPESALTANDGIQYFAICLPCFLGLVIATTLATLLKLEKPQRLTTAVECCYQNTGIATSAALSLFTGDDLQKAMRVPVVYGLVEAIFIGVYLLIFWKLGWSKAPKDEKCCTVITKSYELHEKGEEDGQEGVAVDGNHEGSWNEEGGADPKQPLLEADHSLP